MRGMWDKGGTSLLPAPPLEPPAARSAKPQTFFACQLWAIVLET